MKKIKDFIYNNKKNILLYILAILGMICLANCNIPKAKAAAAITDLNDLWGKSWISNTITSVNEIITDLYITSDTDIDDLGTTTASNTNGNFEGNIAAEVSGEKAYIFRFYRVTAYTPHLARFYIYRPEIEAIDDFVVTNNATIQLNFNDNPNNYVLESSAEDIFINWFNEVFTETEPPAPPILTNNLNIYVNEQLAYNDTIEFIETAVSPSIQYVYSNYTINQMGFGNLAKPLKYTANEFIANVFNFENDNNAFIDFAFTGSYLVGLSYDYTNLSGEQISNSFTFEPDEEESFRLISLTNLQRNDTDINIIITTNNLNDFESGAVNSAFKTLFGFFNEIINIQFGFITIGQILGFILAIAIIGLIYKVWNGGNND